MPQASSNEFPYNRTASRSCEKHGKLIRVKPEICDRCGKRRPRPGESVPKLLGGLRVELDGMVVEIPADCLGAFDFCGCKGQTKIIVP